MHEARIRRHGDPDVVIPQADRNYPTGPAHHGWVEDPDYVQWHQRLRMWKGSASAHTCIRCGETAAHWAFTGQRNGGEVLPYSTNMDDYEPMCVSCHKQFDLDALASAKSSGTPELDIMDIEE
jgi:hypothetical protein